MELSMGHFGVRALIAIPIAIPIVWLLLTDSPSFSDVVFVPHLASAVSLCSKSNNPECSVTAASAAAAAAAK